MMPAPVYAPSFPAPPYPTAQVMPPPPQWPPVAPAAGALVQQSQPARTVRAQESDEPSAPPSPAESPAPLVMPSPEQLGVDFARPAADDSPDWTTFHRRLDRLGACSMHLDKLPAGGCRFSCLLPTGRRDRFHRVESQAATADEAVRLALDDAEKWAGGK